MTNILGEVWGLVWVRVLQSIIIIGCLVLFVRSFWAAVVTILLINTVFDLLEYEEASLKRLLKKHLITLAILGGLAILYSLVGFWGAMALTSFAIALLFIMAGVLIWQNWKIYDSVTSWGAKRIKGETKEEFNLKEALRK